MPRVVRETDLCTGHGCWPPRPPASWSEDVFVEGLGAVRVDDGWVVHCCTDCHSGTQVDGSPTVFVNGRSWARIGDSISCGSRNRDGSPSVWAD